jgi:hypothetical protein
MAEQLNLSINVSGNVEESLGSIKKQLREAQNEVTALSDKFGATSREAVTAAKRAAELKDRIGDAKALTEAFNPDQKFRALTQSLSGVAGGFAAVQGALGLFGNESKEVEKQLLKVQSALSLSQGLESVGNSIDSFKALGTVIKDSAITAFNSLKGAIGATGIGLLVISVGLLVANFDKVKKAVLNLVPGLANAAEFIGKIINQVTDFIGVTSEAERATAKLISENEKAIKNSERFLELNGDKYDEYTQRKIRANIDFKKSQNDLLNDEKLTEDEKNKYIKEAREKANREINASDEERNKKSQEARKKDKEERDKIKKEEEDAKKKRTEDANTAAANALKLQLEAIDNKNEADKKKQEEDDAEIERLFAQEEKTQGVIIESNNKKLLAQKAFDAEVVSAELQLQDAKFAAASAGLNLLGSLVGKNEKLANAIFVVDKALAIAKIIVDTQREIAGYAAAYAPIPGGTAISGPLILGAKIRAGVGIATIAATTISKFKGGATASNFGGGSSITPAGVPIVPQQNQNNTTNLSQSTINALGNQAIKAYVVETDVTSSQQRIAAIQSRARFQ